MGFFPDLEQKIRGIFAKVEIAGGSFGRGNIRYRVKGGEHSTDSLYRRLIDLYSHECKVDVDGFQDVIDGFYVTCDNHRVFIMIELRGAELSVSAWPKN